MMELKNNKGSKGDADVTSASSPIAAPKMLGNARTLTAKKLLRTNTAKSSSHHRLITRAITSRADTVDLIKGLGAEE